MKMRLYMAVVLLMGPGVALADEPWTLFDGCHWRFPRQIEQWRQRCGWCPDDYRAKSLPTVPPGPSGGVDDYCAKRLPAVAPGARGGVDDYCPRKCPLVVGQRTEPWQRCGSAERCWPCPTKP